MPLLIVGSYVSIELLRAGSYVSMCLIGKRYQPGVVAHQSPHILEVTKA